MAHNIAQTADGRDATFYVGERPWHGLGTELENPATAHEAIVAAGLDYEVSKQPLLTTDGLPVPGHRAVVREDAQVVLGVVGERYTLIQNRDAFGFFDGVVGAGQAIYHTAGALGAGERIWALAKIPGELRVNGTDDVVEKFLLLTNTHDGSSALRLFFTPVRVVCQNTLNVALSGGAHQGVSIRHTKNLKSKVAEAQRVLGFAVRYYDDLEGILGRLSDISMTTRAVRAYFESVVPDNPKAESHSRTQNIREDLECLFETGKGNELPGVRRTLWAAVNAVTEYADHHRSTHGQDASDRASSRLKSTWFGSGAKLKGHAWGEALKLAEVA